MPEQTRYDLLGTQIDSEETKVFNSTAVYSLKSAGPDGEVVFNSNETLIPGFVADSSSFALTASYANIANTANTAISSSYALTASFVTGTITSASYAISSSRAVSSSYAVTSSFVTGTVTSASYAITSSYAGTATSANHASTASLALNISASSINSDTLETYDGSNNTSINWGSRRLQDSSLNLSIDWDGRGLYNPAGSKVADWQLQMLTDESGFDSIDWKKRKIYAEDGTVVIDYLTTSSGVAVTGSLTATNGFTGSLQGTSSWATNALTASHVNTLNQNVIITGSVAIGTGSVGSGENNLLLGPAPAGGTGEGGQIALLAAGGSYTSSSFLDNWQNQFRILRGPGATSNAGLMYMDLQSGNTQFVGAVTASAYSGLPNSWLHALRSGNQTIGSGTWASRDIIFNDVSSINFTYNSSTGVATLKAGKTYRITARLAWSAAGLYTLKFRIYNQTTSAYTGPTVELIQSPNGTYNVSDGTLEHMVAVGASDVDISIRTTADTNALTGEYIRGDLNTQLIIQQIA